MNEPVKRGWKRVAAVVIVTLGAIYAINLTQLVLANRRAQALEQTLAARVAAQQHAVETIETMTANAAGDAFVEEYVRENRGWSRPGERVVVPVGDDQASAREAARSGPDEVEVGLWERFTRWLNRGG